MRRRPLVKISVCALILLTLSILLPPSYVLAKQVSQHAQASTPTCTGSGCEGLDPFATSCGSLSVGGAEMVNSAALVDASGLLLARVYNWYSTVCGTNWTQAEVLPDNPGVYANVPIQIDIYRSNHDPVYCYPEDCYSFYTGDVNPTWSNMAYAPNVVAYAEVVVQSPIDHLYYQASIGA